MRLFASSLLTLGVLLGLAACATPKPPTYGPIGDTQPYGYRDLPNADGSRTLLTVVPPHSSLAEAKTFWERRAQELCPAGVAKRIMFRAERKEFLSPAMAVYGGTGFSSRIVQSYQVEGYLFCKPAP